MKKQEIAPDGKPLNKSLIVRIGKYLRQYINPYIKKHSVVPDIAVWDESHFPWLKNLEDNWEVIRDEAEKILKYRDAIPPLSEISPDHARLDAEKKWRSYFLWGYGFKSEENCARCPKTTAIVESLPGLRTALFSIHDPGMEIAPHKGVTAGICVSHLGLMVPKDRASCAIRVDDEVVHWENGKAFAFDDTREHETWNRTDETRAILLLHVDRPVRFPGLILSKLFMLGIRYSPFIGDARRKMGDWNTSFIALEKENAAEN